MDHERDGAPHWNVVPSPELEQKAGAWLRGMIRFIVESTDDADTTPERFERTLGITTQSTPGNARISKDDSDPPYICFASTIAAPAPDPRADLTIGHTNRSARSVRALVHDPDAAWVETELGRAGFTLRPIYPSHEGKPIGMRFFRGRIGGSYGLVGSGGLGHDVRYVTRVVMTWRDPYTTRRPDEHSVRP